MDEKREIECILVVGTTPTMRAMLRRFLSSAFPGCRIHDADTPGRALETCVLESPQAVLVFVDTLDGGGVELLREIRSFLRRCAVVALSEFASSPHIDRILAADAIAVVSTDRIFADLVPTIVGAGVADRP